MFGVIRFHAYPRIGGISPHGVGIAVGYLLGGMLMARRAERRGISSDDVWNMLMRAVIGVIVGARLFYVIGHTGEYFGAGRNPLDLFKVWQGGIVFYGGAVGGVVAAIPYMRKKGYPIGAVLDMAAPAFPLGLIFGRIGDIIVGDHLGGASTLPFAFRFSGEVAHRFESMASQAACYTTGCHQTALYDLLNVLILLPVVLWLARKPRPRGWLMAFTVTWYGGARLFTDFARDAQKYGAGPLELHGTQWFSIALILVGGFYLIRRARSAEPDTWVYEAEPVAVTAAAGDHVAPEATASDPSPTASDPSPPDALPEPEPATDDPPPSGPPPAGEPPL